MARDYKHAEVFSPGTRPLPWWLWLFAALAISGFAGLIYLLDYYEKTKHTNSQAESVGTVVDSAVNSAVDGAMNGAVNSAVESAIDSAIDKVVKQNTLDIEQAGSETDETSRSRFDFYKLLPQLQVDVPGTEESDKQPSGTDEPRQSQPPASSYVLQAGSFKDFQEADRLKAGLALMGIRAHIEKVTLDHSQVWHRVRIGPIDSEREMNRIRSQLRAENIEPVTMKVKG